MVDDILSAAGPIWGPDFVLVEVNDATGEHYELEVFPDANNDQLRAAGRPMQYYWNPKRVYLARKQDSPADYDFGMTLFKGLMTEETSVGVTDANTTDGTVETGGGFCTFATTFAVPPSVITAAIASLKGGSHPSPAGRIAMFFGHRDGNPDPLLGIMPILKNNVTIEVPNLVAASQGAKMPLYLDAQGSGKGSVEASGINAFLVTANELAAGAIVGSLQSGVSPFTVHCNLTEEAYIRGCRVHIEADVSKCYDQMSGALDFGGFLGIGDASLSYAYSKMVTDGGISTTIELDSGNLTPELKDWIMKYVTDMQTTIWNLIKQDIFDWQPREDSPASANRGLLATLFGGASVSLKASEQVREDHLHTDLTLDSTITVENTVSGDLSDLEPAIKAHLDKYLAVVDVGEHFKKVQVAGTCAVDFADNVGNRALADPIESVQLEVSYPDYSHPVAADGTPNLTTQAQGFHYAIGHKDPNAGSELAVWSKDNQSDVVNISFLRLEQDVKGWPADQVKIRKTIVYNGEDPRVELADGTSTFVIETIGTDHAPKLTADEAGYVFVRFLLDRPIPTDNISVTLTAKIGQRTDTLTFTASNQKDVIWEIFSDKYLDVTEFTYALEVAVAGSGFTDDPITWSTAAPVTVALPTGRTKFIDPLKITLPPLPADQRATVNEYIAAYPPVLV